MFTIHQTPPPSHYQLQHTTQYTPHYPSPLSSSPLRSSPSPLKERCENVLGGLPFYTGMDKGNGRSEDMGATSPTGWTKRAQQLQQYSIMDQNENENGISCMQTPIFTPQQHQQHTSIFTPLPPTPPPSRTPQFRAKPAFSTRATKSNPLMDRSSSSRVEEGRETRRKLFLKKVREESEDKKWDRRNRGNEDELMRVLWVGERGREKEWRREEARRVELVGEENLGEFFCLCPCPCWLLDIGR